jgi:cysteine desulfurase/selenocysteine lyase
MPHSTSHFDVEKYRQDFPLLKTKIHGKNLVYFDNAASTQKPSIVLESMQTFYQHSYANVHRGVHSLSEQATALYEKSRDTVKNFIQAKHREEIVFVRGTTEGINLVAQSFLRPMLKPDDEIIISTMEHHSNIVPWQLVCEQTGAKLKVVPITDQGELIFEAFVKLISPKTKFISIAHISNSLGTINPVKKMIETAHLHKIPLLLDGAQAAVHQPVNVQDLDCDFYAFSSHKLYGPTGIGVLYGKLNLLDKMPPYQGGGEMISEVTFEKTTFNVAPHKFEAGTPAIAEAIGLSAAIEYIQHIGLDKIAAHEKQLLDYATQQISQFEDIKIIGTAKHKASILSFVFDSIHSHDIGTILDQEGVAVRTGHHCCMPLMDRMQVAATTRASFALYNTLEEIDVFIFGLKKVREIFLA